MRACESLSLASEAESASSSAASWRRMAWICWLTRSTVACARAESCFSASSAFCDSASRASALLPCCVSIRPCRRVRSPCVWASVDCMSWRLSCACRLEERSRASRSVSSEICLFRRSSAVSLPVSSCERKNWPSTKTVSRKTMPISIVESASTKPGQKFVSSRRWARERAIRQVPVMPNEIMAR